MSEYMIIVCIVYEYNFLFTVLDFSIQYIFMAMAILKGVGIRVRFGKTSIYGPGH